MSPFLQFVIWLDNKIRQHHSSMQIFFVDFDVIVLLHSPPTIRILAFRPLCVSPLMTLLASLSCLTDKIIVLLTCLFVSLYYLLSWHCSVSS